MRHFTKSRFKIAQDCPTKLYYSNNPEIYANSKNDDPFLKALAKGGFQVGALAQCYYPGGHLINTKNKTEALNQTNELLRQDNVVIFEAAVLYENLFIRIDILEKKGNTLRILEVKSKSCDSTTFYDEIWNKNELKKGNFVLNSTWESYLVDVAFQAQVCRFAFPNMKLESYLMCPDKTKLTTVEGLNQRFFLKEDNEVELIGMTTPEALGDEILTRLDVTDIVEKIHRQTAWGSNIKTWVDACVDNTRLPSTVGAGCKKCEFRCEDQGLKSGFKECWQRKYPELTNEDLDRPLVFDVWYLNSAKALSEHKILMEELDETDFTGTRGDRQWLQVEKVKSQDDSSFLDLKGLGAEVSNFKYPLHMIDFETCMVAIPFNEGMSPYQQIAFQFSHHMIQEDGKVEHANEYINCELGVFPNFHFVRELKKALSRDLGTIFRYSNHENTVLKQIKAQLEDSQEKDKKALMAFIDSITDDAPRTMVDLCELVKKYYYSPLMGGSNSIKVVLPAILYESELLKKKYGQPIYNSGNFRNHQWIVPLPGGEDQDPYKTLGPALNKYDYETLEAVMSSEQGDISKGAGMKVLEKFNAYDEPGVVQHSDAYVISTLIFRLRDIIEYDYLDKFELFGRLLTDLPEESALEEIIRRAKGLHWERTPNILILIPAQKINPLQMKELCPSAKCMNFSITEGDLWEITTVCMKALERSGEFTGESKDTEFLDLKIEHLPKAMVCK